MAAANNKNKTTATKNASHRNERRQNEIETVAIDTVSIKLYAERMFLLKCVNYYFADTGKSSKLITLI